MTRFFNISFLIVLLFICNVEVFAQNIGNFTSLEPLPQNNNFVIPSTHKFQKIIEKGDVLTQGGVMPERTDFTGYVPINGSSENGYLSISSESTPGGVSILDINFNQSTKLWETTLSKAVDFSGVGGTERNCSGTVTPWNTIITCEERVSNLDSNNDNYNDLGWCIEINPATKTVIDKRWALGNFQHENIAIHSNERTVYEGADSNPGYLYKFVSDNVKDLSSGVLYVYSGSKNGSGNWIQINNTTKTERNTTLTQSANVGATVFNGIEDVEIGPDGLIYFAVKGENRVYRFQDSDPISGTTVSNMETFVGNASYNVVHKTGTSSVVWGYGNDNLAFDGEGNLWVFQDGENNYIWLVEPSHTQAIPKVKIFGRTPLGSEPTGITFSPDYRFLFMSLQSPSGSTSQVDASGNTINFDKDISLVIALKENLGHIITNWSGNSNSDWATSGNWSNGIPTSSSNVFIPSGLSNYPIISSTTGAIVNDLTIDSNGSLTVNSGGSLIVKGTSTGDVTCKLNIIDENWHLLSSPVVGQEYNTTWVNDNLIDNTTSLGTNVGIATYINTTGVQGDWSYVLDNESGTFNSGKGYSIKRDDTGSDISFTSTLKTDNLVISIDQGFGGENKWNLIGNPYPSYIKVSDVVSANTANLTDTHETVYVWNGNDYIALTGNDYLSPGQGFFVNSANSNANNFTISENLQSHQNGITFYKTSNIPTIKLNVTDGNVNKFTEINYLTGKTEGLDKGFDVGTFTGVSNNFSIYSHLVSANTGVNFMRQVVPKDYENLIIPIGINSEKEKEITFSVEALKLPTQIKIFLEDKLTNTFTRLDGVNTNYKVNLKNTLFGVGRFYLHTTKSLFDIGADIELNNVVIFVYDNQTLRIDGLKNIKTRIKLFNVFGQQIISSSLLLNGVDDILLPKLPAGFYIVQLENELGKLDRKILIE